MQKLVPTKSVLTIGTSIQIAKLSTHKGDLNQNQKK